MELNKDEVFQLWWMLRYLRGNPMADSELLEKLIDFLECHNSPLTLNFK